MTSNDLPAEVKKDNVFKRLYKFIKSFFSKYEKNNIVEDTAVIEKETKIRELYKVANLEEISSNIINEANKKRTLEEIIQIIEKEPEILKKLDIPKLKVIDKYYKDKIIEYRKKLENT